MEQLEMLANQSGPSKTGQPLAQMLQTVQKEQLMISLLQASCRPDACAENVEYVLSDLINVEVDDMIIIIATTTAATTTRSLEADPKTQYLISSQHSPNCTMAGLAGLAIFFPIHVKLLPIRPEQRCTASALWWQ